MSAAAATPNFICKLKSRQVVAEGTMAFHFEKPTGWTFKPGQYVDITLLDPSETDSEGNERSLSIASSPHEVTLMVATRMRDTAFKRELKRMPLGSQVKIDGPLGSFTLHSNASRPAVFLCRLLERVFLKTRPPEYEVVSFSPPRKRCWRRVTRNPSR